MSEPQYNVYFILFYRKDLFIVESNFLTTRNQNSCR